MKKKVSGQMKSLITFLFAAVLCLSARPAAAQTARVTIDMRQVKMERVMAEIEKQTQYLFIYDKSLDIDHTVSVVADNLPVSDALTQMVRGTGLAYEINGSNIILTAAAHGAAAGTAAATTPAKSPVRSSMPTACR